LKERASGEPVKKSIKYLAKANFLMPEEPMPEEQFDENALEENELDSLEAVPEGQEKEYLVDLIDQPAWKSILVELVKSNKMEPWNIDVVELANLYWQKIQQLERQDLRVPANAILASAILLKLKARTIKISSVDEEDEEAKEISREELALIEETIPELRGQRQFREGHISLDELVGSIEEILEKTKQRKSILRDKELMPDFNLEFNKGGAAEQVEAVLARIKERVDSQGLVTFSALLEKKTPMAMVNCFIPVLFLVNKGRINAWQDEWFGEIFVNLIEKAKAEKKQVLP